MKDKACRNQECGKAYTPTKPMQIVCSLHCAIAYSRAKKIREDRSVTRARKQELNKADRKWWLKKATTSCNAYIRKRDEKLPCVSCQRFHKGQYHAGHYRPAGNNSVLRFHEANIHKQCSPCNLHKSANLIEYRIHLIQKIGLETVEWLERQNEVKRWTIEELRAIADDYNRRLRDLKGE